MKNVLYKLFPLNCAQPSKYFNFSCCVCFKGKLVSSTNKLAERVDVLTRGLVKDPSWIINPVWRRARRGRHGPPTQDTSVISAQSHPLNLQQVSSLGGGNKRGCCGCSKP